MRTFRTSVCSVALVMVLTGCGSGDVGPDLSDDAAGTEGDTAGSVPAPAEVSAEVPAGTTVTFELDSTLSAANNESGEVFRATVSEDVVVGGETLIPAGAPAEGRILEATESGRVQGVAEIALQITSISVDGERVPISTGTFEARAETSRTEDATTIGAGAGIGAAIGGILGGGDGAALGAAIGGGGGTAVVLATRGDDIELPAGTRINFVLDGAAVLP